MIRIIVVVALAVLAFAGALVASMAATGNLTQEALDHLLGRTEESAPAGKTPPVDPLNPMMSKIKAEQERLKAKEKELGEWEERLRQRERALDGALEEATRMQEQIQAALDTLDADRDQRVEEVAKSVAAMSPKNAAESLGAFPPEEAAEILQLIKERDRGRILDGMDGDKRALVLQIMQERKY